MNTIELHNRVVAAALKQNGWDVERTITLRSERGDGEDVNGVVKFDRPRLHGNLPAHMAELTFGTARWAMSEDGTVRFFSGNYDLSSLDASKDFNERGKGGIDRETLKVPR